MVDINLEANHPFVKDTISEGPGEYAKFLFNQSNQIVQRRGFLIDNLLLDTYRKNQKDQDPRSKSEGEPFGFRSAQLLDGNFGLAYRRAVSVNRKVFDYSFHARQEMILLGLKIMSEIRYTYGISLWNFIKNVDVQDAGKDSDHDLAWKPLAAIFGEFHDRFMRTLNKISLEEFAAAFDKWTLRLDRCVSISGEHVDGEDCNEPNSIAGLALGRELDDKRSFRAFLSFQKREKSEGTRSVDNTGCGAFSIRFSLK